MPSVMSTVFKALPAMLVISLCRNEFRALLASKPPDLPVPPPSPRYMPVASMATASFPRSSLDMATSWFWMEASSGASRVNSSPMFSSELVMATPTSKLTDRGTSFSVTVERTRSVATMFMLGFIGFPVNSTKLPLRRLNVLSGMTGSSYFICPFITV